MNILEKLENWCVLCGYCENVSIILNISIICYEINNGFRKFIIE